MAFWEAWRFRRAPAQPVDPAMRAIAEAIAHNLAALGLYVDSRPYGRGFFEIKASTSAKLITTPDGTEASGIALLLAGAYEPPSLVFEQINSLRRGLGRAMVEAVIAGTTAQPEAFRRFRVNDLSPRLQDGRRWWEHVAAAHPEFEWVITHEEPFNSGR
ncbi:MAG: hypothetical protein FJX16_02280 [Alphaproteobacteria bacterium]|nr:hypothetical protein [Alphaproteobacteria bacterium]MBM3624145.1 hypothetical protein [Alphaproteobacteria bacterium]